MPMVRLVLYVSSVFIDFVKLSFLCPILGYFAPFCDTIDYDGVSFTNLNSQLNTFRSGTSYIVQAKNNLSASTYALTASVDDEHSFSTNTETDSFTVAASRVLHRC